MNILQVLPKLDEGGVETGTVDLARYLVLNGHKAVVISDGGRLVKRLNEIGARHYEFPVGRKSIFTFILSISKIIEVVRKENVQIIHARSRVPALAAFFASRVINAPFVTTAHGYYKKHLISQVMGWGKFVIVASNAMGYHMVKNFGTPPEKIRLIPRGVDLNNFEYWHPDKKKTSPFTIGMISRISPLKGHSYFLHAVSLVARKIPNLKVLIIGGVAKGKENYKRDLDLLVRRLALTETVEFLGPREDVQKILSELNLLVSSSIKQEAFGRVIIEAQAAGVPVVATAVGGIVDIVKDGQTALLCSPEDPQDLADKIIKVAKDKNLQKSLSENARKVVEEKFTLEKMAGSTLEVYEDVLRKKRILVIKLSAMGDVILSIPSLRAIRNKFNDAEIRVLVGIKSKDILTRCPYIDGIIVYDYKGKNKGLKEFLTKCSHLRRMNFDMSIDLQNNRCSHLLAALSLIPLRIGYNNKKLSFLLNRKISNPKKPLDPVSHQARLLGLLAVPMEEKHLELWPSDTDKEWADKLLEEAWVSKSQLLIGINPSASVKWATKRWPVENFAKLNDMLASKLSARVIITGTKEDEEISNKLMGLCKSRPIMAVGKATLMQLAALIKKCNVFVTSDSAPMHIASACNVRFVALFGPTGPERHLAPCKNCVVIRKKLRCSPCYNSKCIIGHKCMRKITVEEVFNAVKGLIK